MAAMFDVSERTRITLTGRDRAKFLHSFCTNDIVKLQPGQGTEAFITSSQGKTIGHVLVACLADRLELNTVAGQGACLIQNLDRFLITEDVTLRDTTAEFAQRLIGGEGAATKLAAALGGEVPAGRLECTAQPCFVQRVEILGAASFLLAFPSAAAAEWDAKLSAAGIVPGADYHAARIAAAWPEFAADFDEDNLPQEIGRDTQAISFKKGCYLGQETVARLDALGHVNRKLARLKYAGPAGAELTADGKAAGQVKSVAGGQAWAIVRVAQLRPGTILQTEHGPAEVIG